MKGLIVKDICIINNYKRMLIPFLCIFLLISLQTPSMLYFGFFIIAMSSMNATFGYDEKASWDCYAVSLPVTKKEIVKSKYLLSSLLLIVSCLLSLGLSILISILMKQPLNLTEAVSQATGYLFAISLVSAIQYPFIFKYGIEKGRIFLFVGSMLILAIVLGFAYLIDHVLWFHQGVDQLNIFLNQYPVLLPFLLVIASIVCFLISYLCAKKLYQNKEL